MPPLWETGPRRWWTPLLDAAAWMMIAGMILGALIVW